MYFSVLAFEILSCFLDYIGRTNINLVYSEDKIVTFDMDERIFIYGLSVKERSKGARSVLVERHLRYYSQFFSTIYLVIIYSIFQKNCAFIYAFYLGVPKYEFLILFRIQFVLFLYS